MQALGLVYGLGNMHGYRETSGDALMELLESGRIRIKGYTSGLSTYVKSEDASRMDRYWYIRI